MKIKLAVKSIVLMLLIVLSILQVEKLWFENSSNRSFFNMIPQRKASYPAVEDLVLEPKQIAIYRAGNKGEYRVLDTAGILHNSVLKDTGKLIKQLPQMQRLNKYEYEDLYNRPHILYQLAVPISVQLLYQVAESKGEKEEENITSMAVLPAGLEESRFGILFFNARSELAAGFTIPKSEFTDENNIFAQYINSQLSAKETLLLSAKQQGINVFQAEVLLPSPKQDFILPVEWKPDLPFLQGDGEKIDKEKLEGFLFSFTKNPKILWNIEEKDRIRYGDSTILMEYNNKGAFRYHYIQPTENPEKISLNEALQISADFMTKDVYIGSQELKLAAYEVKEEGYELWYDYYYRGYPLLWDENLKNRYGTDYPLKVEVVGKQVTKYERVLLGSERLLLQGSRFQVNYEEVLNQFFQKNEKSQIKSLSLGYFGQDNKIVLGWIIETEQNRYFYALPQEGISHELE